MKKIGILLVIILLAFSSFCQSNVPEEIEQTFTIVEQMPLFDGATTQEESTQKVMNYIEQKAEASGVTEKGNVFVNVTIDSEGKVTNANILRGLSDETNNVAIMIINSMTTWKPGFQRGKAVDVIMNFVVRFN